MMYRLMKSRRDATGASFALERARLWREYVNKVENKSCTAS